MTTVIPGDDYDDIEAAIPATTVRVDHSNRNASNNNSQQKDSEMNATNNDKVLMPPPSVPLKNQIR